MSLQGSIHTWSDGIGYGAFIPADRAYYNVRTPRASGRRPSSEQLREYRRHNVTGGIDTHRSSISFGKTTESVRGGREGDLRAREATKSLTSGEVGSFVWPAERARDGDVETILAASSAAASNESASSLSVSDGKGSKHGAPPTMLSPHSVKQHEKTVEAQVVPVREQEHRPPQQEHAQQQGQQQSRGGDLDEISTIYRSPASTSSKHRGASSQRSDSTCVPSSSSSSIGSCTSSRLSTFRSTASSTSSEIHNTGRRSISSSSSSSSSSSRSSSRSSTRSRRCTPRPTSFDATNQGAALAPAERQLTHRSSSSNRNGGSARENRLRPPTLRAHVTAPATSSSAPKAPTRLPLARALDPVFDRHHKYDLMAEERAAKGGEVTGRFGEVHGSSVLAASQLTSELSTPWSHVLRGQKW